MKKRTIFEILRDKYGWTHAEALEEMRYTISEIESGNYDAIEENLGLEPDYIFEIMDAVYPIPNIRF